MVGGGSGSRSTSHLFSSGCIVPPFAANGGPDDECEHGNNAEDERRELPTTGPLLLLNGEVLLSVQSLLFLGELLFDGNSSLSFFGCVAEQGMGFWREEEHHRCDDARESFHMIVPFLEMGTKNPAR